MIQLLLEKNEKAALEREKVSLLDALQAESKLAETARYGWRTILKYSRIHTRISCYSTNI